MALGGEKEKSADSIRSRPIELGVPAYVGTHVTLKVSCGERDRMQIARIMEQGGYHASENDGRDNARVTEKVHLRLAQTEKNKMIRAFSITPSDTCQFFP